MDMDRYAEYQDSGIRWIGKVPKIWKSNRIKYLYRIISGNGFPEYLQGNTEGELPFYKVSDINGDGRFVSESANYVSYEQAKENRWSVIPPNALLMAKIGAALSKNHRKINISDCLVDNNVQALVSYKKIHPIFAYYLWLLIDMSWFDNGGTIPSVNNQRLLNQKVFLPDYEVQQTIALYLDSRTAKIDALLSDLQTQAEMLSTYNRELITEAVTKGLDKSVPMKDSGVDWIGEVPADWTFVPLRAVAIENSVKNAGNTCKNLLSLSYGKIIQKDINTNFGLLPESFEGYQIVQPGYTVLRLTDLQNDKRSLRTGYVTETGIITSAYLGLIPSEQLDSKYFTYLLHAYDLKKIYYGLGGGLRQSLKYSDMKSIPILIPPIPVQKSIVEFIDEKITQVDGLIADITEQIEKLKKYRQIVIHDAVTGKIWVPEVRDNGN